MHKRTITYTDYNGNQRTEEFYFNLTKAEAVEMNFNEVGGMEEAIKRIIDAKDNKSIIGMFKDIILKSYGEKSPDGKRFMKSKEISESFAQTEAFSDLFMELASNADKAAEFVNGIMPKAD